MTQHFIKINSLSINMIKEIINTATLLKNEVKNKQFRTSLQNCTIGLYFEKPSLRTQVSFEVGISQLGGNTCILTPQSIGLGKRESIADISKVLSRYLSGIVLRTLSHNTVEEFSQYANIPVINGLTDLCHPCQALADILTIKDYFEELETVQVTYIGDGNNVARSLIEICHLLKIKITICSPPGYIHRLSDIQDKFTYVENIFEASKNSFVIYTDVWTSMGDENEKDLRKTHFSSYRVTEKVIKNANPSVIFMHCLPANRLEEVSPNVIDGKHSVVFQQAENRMHVQKALLLHLLKKV